MSLHNYKLNVLLWKCTWFFTTSTHVTWPGLPKKSNTRPRSTAPLIGNSMSSLLLFMYLMWFIWILTEINKSFFFLKIETHWVKWLKTQNYNNTCGILCTIYEGKGSGVISIPTRYARLETEKIFIHSYNL